MATGKVDGLPAMSSENSDFVYTTNQNQTVKAWQDIQAGFSHWRVWFLLGQQDIRLRYRRSVLGPFWLTLSMAITIYSMGFLYGHLFRLNVQEYLPFLATGMLTWTFISTTITDMTEAFVGSENLIKQIKLPYNLYIHRVAWRNLLIFFHNILVYLPILVLFHESAKLNLYSLLFIPNLILMYFCTILYGMIFALIGTRYRDIPQIIRSLIQVAFFLTPVLWSPAVLPDRYHYVFQFNPFYALIELLRAPMMGQPLSTSIYAMVGALIIVGLALVWVLFTKSRSRIIYWL